MSEQAARIARLFVRRRRQGETRTSSPQPGNRSSVSVLIACAIVAGSIATLSPVITPLLLPLLVKIRHLDILSVGVFASVEAASIGLSATAAALSPLSQRRYWPRCVLLGTFLLVVGNILTTAAYEPSVLIATRAAAGAGTGCILTAAYGAFALGRRTRTFAIFTVSQVGLGVAVASVIEPLSRNFGLTGSYGIFSALSLVGGALYWFTLKWNSEISAPEQTEAFRDDLSSSSAERVAGDLSAGGRIGAVNVLAAASVLFYACAMSGQYQFSVMLAISRGLPRDASDHLTVAILTGILVTSSIVVLFSPRMKQLPFVLLSYAATIVLSGILLLETANVMFLLLIALAISWTVFTPFQFDFVVSHDGSSRSAALFNSATMLGSAFGPQIYGLTYDGSFNLSNRIAWASYLVAGLFLFLSWVLRVKREGAARGEEPDQSSR